MDHERYVSREQFELVVKALVLRVQTLGELVSATTAMLTSKGILAGEDFREILARSQRSGTAARLKQALDDLPDFEAIYNALRDFDGPA